MIKLEKASDTDAEEILSMQQSAFAPLLKKYKDYETNPAAESLERVRERLAYTYTDTFFIVVENTKVGCIRIAHNNEVCTLKQILILPQFQGYGYAQTAIALAESLYSQKVWRLDTIKQENKLRHLYEKLEYKQTGKEQKVSDIMTLIFYQKIK